MGVFQIEGMEIDQSQERSMRKCDFSFSEKLCDIAQYQLVLLD